MSFSIVREPDRLAVKLEGSVTIRDAQEMAARLRESVDGEVPVGVDTEKLEDIDTCMLQLLYSLRTSAPTVVFDSPSEAFVTALERTGLRREFLSVKEAM